MSLENMSGIKEGKYLTISVTKEIALKIVQTFITDNIIEVNKTCYIPDRMEISKHSDTVYFRFIDTSKVD